MFGVSDNGIILTYRRKEPKNMATKKSAKPAAKKPAAKKAKK